MSAEGKPPEWFIVGSVERAMEWRHLNAVEDTLPNRLECTLTSHMPGASPEAVEEAVGAVLQTFFSGSIGGAPSRLYYSERKLWEECPEARPVLERLARYRKALEGEQADAD